MTSKRKLVHWNVLSSLYVNLFMPYSSVYLGFCVILTVAWGKEREQGLIGLSLFSYTSCILTNSGRKKYALSIMMCEISMIFKMWVLLIEEVMWKKK